MLFLNKKLLNVGPEGVSGLYYKNIMTIVSDDCKWSLYHKCVIALALAIGLSSIMIVLLMLRIVASLMIVIYDCRVFLIQIRVFYHEVAP
jgi:hypothetical protein